MTQSDLLAYKDISIISPLFLRTAKLKVILSTLGININDLMHSFLGLHMPFCLAFSLALGVDPDSIFLKYHLYPRFGHSFQQFDQ